VGLRLVSTTLDEVRPKLPRATFRARGYWVELTRLSLTFS